MSSIQRVQTERLLEDVAHILYSEGSKPTTAEIMKLIAKHISEYPAGSPLPVPLRDGNTSQVSDPKEFNRFIDNTKVNLDVLYESMLGQLDQALQLVNTMVDDVKRLAKRRRELESLVDDYLLATVNSEGYFYAISDVFSTLNRVDLSLTSAQVNVDKGEISLPSVPYTTQKVPAEFYRQPTLAVQVDGEAHSYRQLSSFTNATQSGLENTHWQVEVVTDSPSEVVMVVDINFTTPVDVTRFSFDPYGIEPVQLSVFTINDGSFTPFGGRAVTGVDEVSLTNRAIRASGLRLTLRKTAHDYTEVKDGSVSYRYILGAKSIECFRTIYDYDATFVTKPLSIDSNLQDDSSIDAVSVEVKEIVPEGTSLDYYVGASTGESESLSDVQWQRITPVNSNSSGEKVIRFNGATSSIKVARSNPTGPNDVPLKPLKTSGPVSEQNPSLQIFPGTEIYRIADVNETVFKGSLKMVEGLNTIRIYSRPQDLSKSFDDIDILYWSQKFSDPNTTIDYARIDAGNDFFYGGDVGASGQDIYVETFLKADTNYATFLSEFAKSDTRSRTWNVKVYLNGREIGDLPAGTDRAQLPWNLNQGLNHVVLIIRIPSGSSNFLGTVRLLQNEKLFDYGLVHLREWRYVDPFEMRYNERGTNNATFTIIDGEIVSRRPPTDNFQIRYSLDSGQAPKHIRFRADLSRVKNSPTVSPVLKEYRVRFAYGD